MGQVPNITCTAIRAKWGVIARSVVAELELIWVGPMVVSQDDDEARTRIVPILLVDVERRKAYALRHTPNRDLWLVK
jgi:hypothetical protein